MKEDVLKGVWMSGRELLEIQMIKIHCRHV